MKKGEYILYAGTGYKTVCMGEIIEVYNGKNKTVFEIKDADTGRLIQRDKGVCMSIDIVVDKYIECLKKRSK